MWIVRTFTVNSGDTYHGQLEFKTNGEACRYARDLLLNGGDVGEYDLSSDGFRFCCFVPARLITEVQVFEEHDALPS